MFQAPLVLSMYLIILRENLFLRFGAERMSEEVIESLRGKVLEKEEKEDGQQWTPYNANMSMQGIKVRNEGHGQSGPFLQTSKCRSNAC